MNLYNIIKEPKRKEYIKFINYILDESDYFSFKITTRIPDEERIENEFNKICSLLNVNKEEAIKNYKNKVFIENAYNKLKNVEEIMTNWSNPFANHNLEDYNITEEEYEKMKQKWIKEHIENTLFWGAGKFIYEENIKKIKECLKDDYIKEENDNDNFNEIVNHLNKEQDKLKYVIRYKTYYYKISEKSKELLLSRKRLYNMLFPDFPEDITFYRNNILWIETISHEHMAFVEFNDKQEVKYIKNIGLKISKEIYYIVEEEINNWDPIRKLKLNIPQEKREIYDTYCIEISRILGKIKEKNDINKIANIIYKVFIEMYDEIYNEVYIEIYDKNILNDVNKFKQECKIIAEKIYVRINE